MRNFFTTSLLCSVLCFFSISSFAATVGAYFNFINPSNDQATFTVYSVRQEALGQFPVAPSFLGKKFQQGGIWHLGTQIEAPLGDPKTSQDQIVFDWELVKADGNRQLGTCKIRVFTTVGTDGLFRPRVKIQWMTGEFGSSSGCKVLSGIDSGEWGDTLHVDITPNYQ